MPPSLILWIPLTDRDSAAGSSQTSSEASADCGMRVDLSWSKALGTGVYSQIAVDRFLDSTDAKQILIPGFDRPELLYVDDSGLTIRPYSYAVGVNLASLRSRAPEVEQQPPGMDSSEELGGKFHSAPLLVDVNGDGIRDRIWTSVDGEIFAVDGRPGHGLLTPHPWYLPKLRVYKHWWKTGASAASASSTANGGEGKTTAVPSTPVKSVTEVSETVDSNLPLPPRRSATTTTSSSPDRNRASEKGGSPDDTNDTNATGAADERSHEADPSKDTETLSVFQSTARGLVTGIPWTELSAPAQESFRLLLTPGEGAHPYEEDPLHSELYPREPNHVYVDAHVLTEPSAVDIDGDGVPELILAVSYFFDEGLYSRDPHLREQHLDPDVDIRKYVAGGVVVFSLREGRVLWQKQLDLTTDDFQPSMTTTTTADGGGKKEGSGRTEHRRAYIYSAPSIADLDGDGELEIILGTSLGMVYVLNARDGALRPGFPVILDEIQAQIGVEDVNGDGRLELIVPDRSGRVVCLDADGKTVWRRFFGRGRRRTMGGDGMVDGYGWVVQRPSFGDVDRDGSLDVVLGTLDGRVFALRGDTGATLDGFPVMTVHPGDGGGRIVSSIGVVEVQRSAQLQAEILRRLQSAKTVSQKEEEEEEMDGETPGRSVLDRLLLDWDLAYRREAVYLIWPSQDGVLHILDPEMGCLAMVDTGESIFSAPVVEDLQDRGRVEILLASMTGELQSFTLPGFQQESSFGIWGVDPSFGGSSSGTARSWRSIWIDRGRLDGTPTAVRHLRRQSLVGEWRDPFVPGVSVSGPVLELPFVIRDAAADFRETGGGGDGKVCPLGSWNGYVVLCSCLFD